MSNDNVIDLIQPGIFDDQLTEVLRNEARALLARAVEAEVADFLGKHADLKTQDGHQRRPPRSPAGARGDDRYRSGRRPPAACTRSRGRRCRSCRIRFSPSILPPYTLMTAVLSVAVPGKLIIELRKSYPADF